MAKAGQKHKKRVRRLTMPPDGGYHTPPENTAQDDTPKGSAPSA